jgi:hypothetical protein
MANDHLGAMKKIIKRAQKNHKVNAKRRAHKRTKTLVGTGAFLTDLLWKNKY